MEGIQPLPRQTVEAEFAAERACAICGVEALAVVHLERLPDHIKCSNCGSAFVVSEGSNQVMYGSIPPNYPSTRGFALRRWVALAAVQVKASSEQAAGASPGPVEGSDSTPPFGFRQADQAETAPTDEPTPPLGIGSSAGPGNGTAAGAATPPFGIGTLHEFLGQEPAASLAQSSPPAGEAILSYESAEPDPGLRFRVAVGEGKTSFPASLCAHCLRQPAPMRLVVIAGDSKKTRYQVPLCRQCLQRASTRSEDALNSRLAAHLGSVLVAMVLMVAAIAFRIVDIRQAPLVAGGLLGVLGLIGYALPAWLLLSRISRLPSPPDAMFVRSTLLVHPRADGEPTTFAWRSRGYAERFASVNTASQVTRVVEGHGSST